MVVKLLWQDKPLVGRYDLIVTNGYKQTVVVKLSDYSNPFAQKAREAGAIRVADLPVHYRMHHGSSTRNILFAEHKTLNEAKAAAIEFAKELCRIHEKNLSAQLQLFRAAAM